MISVVFCGNDFHLFFLLLFYAVLVSTAILSN